MKTFALTVASVIVIGSCVAAHAEKTAPQAGTGIGQRIPPFTAKVIDVSPAKPQTADFDSAKVKRVTAYIFIGTTCPATNAYAERFKQLEQTYRAKGVDFIYIYSNSNDTTEAKLAFQKEKQLGGRLIDDQGGRLARLFNAHRTSELFIADKHGIVVYHGAVDDSRDPKAVKKPYLSDALNAVLKGKPITVANTDVFA